ncbi:MAG: hypothetical protein OER86_08935, partial [Phycisphaerae bacterium]|nr:hypothetical protein [Phycisphaerae bacterium]
RRIDPRELESHSWQEDEFQAVLQGQMLAPLELELGTVDPVAWSSHFRALARAASPPIETLLDLFLHDDPPLDLLVAVKDYAKGLYHDDPSPLPREVAAVLYFASLAVAGRHHDRKITDLDDAAVRRGTAWASTQDWVDDTTRRLLAPVS